MGSVIVQRVDEQGIGSGMSCLAIRPYDHAWGWFASLPEYATPLTLDDAEEIIAQHFPQDRLRIIPDPYRREPVMVRGIAAALSEAR